MNEDVVAVFIPIVAIVMSLGIPMVWRITDYRRRRAIVESYHKERMAAIERGMDLTPLPENFLNPLAAPRHLLTGMIWFFIGLTLFVALRAVAGEDVSYFGLIPAGVGVAFLIYYVVEGRHEVKALREREAGKASTEVARV
jgi:hypothetical protein